MIAFETKVHIEIDENYQGINLTQFSIISDKNIDEELIVDMFIKTSSFSYDSLRDCVKKEPNNSYLRRVFNIEKINIKDFKRYSKEGTTKFLTDFLNEPDWGDDKADFVSLLDKYSEIHKQLGDNIFYIISKDWFDKDDERLVEPESWIYIYYILIISVDIKSKLLTLTEWTYD